MITITKKLMPIEEMKQRIVVSSELSKLREKKIDEIRRVLKKEDNRLLLIIGPCSADNEDAFFSYLTKLQNLKPEIEDKILIIPRLYTAKPRSKGDSYKGIIYSRHPLEDVADLEYGLFIARKMFVFALSEFGFVCADELLHTDTYGYFEDIAAYAVIGARNSESQQHRFLASGIDFPVALKNPLNGNLESLLNAIETAQRENTFIYNGTQAKTSGNPFAHAILRGGVDRHGNHFPNYSNLDLMELKRGFEARGIMNPSVLIDVNHSNSGKNYENQHSILIESLKRIRDDESINGIFSGYMVESYLKDGACLKGEYESGKSVTDGCIGWEKTENLLREMAQIIK